VKLLGVVSLLLLVAGTAGCPAAPPPPAAPPTEAPAAAAPPSRSGPLDIDPAGVDFSRSPRLVRRLKESPHSFFRFVNASFCREVCRRFSAEVRTMPTLNLHGDPHVEQYAVTSLGRGLTDFDDSTSGPGIVDLVRFGVSARLVCKIRGWEAYSGRVLDAFLAGYREGLVHPKRETAEPAMASRIRAGFTPDKAAFYGWIDSLMKPLTVDRRELEGAIASYAAKVQRQRPDLPAGFFKVQKLGSLQQGVGSALDEKYLVRVQGPGPGPLDDVVLEVKEVRPPSGASCVNRSDTDPFRIMVAQSRLAYRPYRFLGYTRRGKRMFWVHEWMQLYKQLAIHKKKYLGSVQDLEGVARDVGLQLGRGHPNQIAAPLEDQVRQRQLDLVNELEPRLKQTIEEMAAQTLASWERFKKKM